MNPVKNQSFRIYVITTTVLGFLAVAIGAFGAHGLKETIGERLPVFETGSRYHFYHLIVCLVIVSLYLVKPENISKLVSVAYWLFVTGILFFSGSLYVYSVTGIKILGAITPIGGIFFMIGWVLLGVGLYQSFLSPKKN
ncbi:DUF423 domain-containing protein [Leptospira sp. 'Mane']|uniref:DUF423 domain-containing protein n=1 Tax=Leptospira sp. 'Mane' TaxID=3387407 RepID=UPI00398A6467